MRGKTKFLIAGVLIAVAVAYLVISSTASTAHYFLTIEELQAMGQQAVGRKVTVSGAVLGDTIAYDASIPRIAFTIVQIPGDPKEVERAGGLAQVLHDAVGSTTAPRLEISHKGVKPDLLRNEAQAILRGVLKDDGRFYADEVLLKCPTRYAAEVPAQQGSR